MKVKQIFAAGLLVLTGCVDFDRAGVTDLIEGGEVPRVENWDPFVGYERQTAAQKQFWERLYWQIVFEENLMDPSPEKGEFQDETWIACDVEGPYVCETLIPDRLRWCTDPCGENYIEVVVHFGTFDMCFNFYGDFGDASSRKRFDCFNLTGSDRKDGENDQ